MVFYFLAFCFGAVLLLLFLFHFRKNTAKKPTGNNNIPPILNKNIRHLKSCECSYRPDMRITLHTIEGEKECNKMIDNLKERTYELNILFDKTRYSIERTEFGEFLTASDIFEVLIGKKDEKEFKAYIKEKKDLKRKVKSFKKQKRDLEDLMQELLHRSIMLRDQE
ncbi:MAG: hypothetical protein U9N35_03060 [Euryarchaeota archaeon]|nr:hypothetical protein [Euryarchaeota archaeon]